MSSSDSSSRNSSPPASDPSCKGPPLPKRKGQPDGQYLRQVYINTACPSNVSGTSGPSETDSDISVNVGARSTKSSGPSEPDSDTSAAAALVSFHNSSKDESGSSSLPRCSTAMSSISSSSNHRQMDAAVVSDPLGLLRHSEHIASAAARSAADAARERISRTKKRRPEKSEEELRAERLAANRKSAAASRQRRKILIEELQSSVSSLVKENAEIRRENEELKEEVNRLQKENKKLREAVEKRKRSPSPTRMAHNPMSHPHTGGGGDAQPQQFAPTAMGNMSSNFSAPQLSTPSFNNGFPFTSTMGNSTMNNAFFANQNSNPFRQQMQPQQLPSFQQQAPMNQSQNAASLPFLLQQQLATGQLNQEFLRQCPPHVLRMLLENQQSS